MPLRLPRALASGRARHGPPRTNRSACELGAARSPGYGPRGVRPSRMDAPLLAPLALRIAAQRGAPDRERAARASRPPPRRSDRGLGRFSPIGRSARRNALGPGVHLLRRVAADLGRASGPVVAPGAGRSLGASPLRYRSGTGRYSRVRRANGRRVTDRTFPLPAHRTTEAETPAPRRHSRWKRTRCTDREREVPEGEGLRGSRAPTHRSPLRSCDRRAPHRTSGPPGSG